jgi:hypothetical protein
MEIKIKLKIAEGLEIELTDEQSKDLYHLLKKLHEDQRVLTYPIIIKDWIRDYPWYSPPYYISDLSNKISVVSTSDAIVYDMTK